LIFREYQQYQQRRSTISPLFSRRAFWEGKRGEASFCSNDDDAFDDDDYVIFSPSFIYFFLSTAVV